MELLTLTLDLVYFKAFFVAFFVELSFLILTFIYFLSFLVLLDVLFFWFSVFDFDLVTNIFSVFNDLLTVLFAFLVIICFTTFFTGSGLLVLFETVFWSLTTFFYTFASLASAFFY